jgi:Predicted nucleic acid-binding protein, contains PIN domain
MLSEIISLSSKYGITIYDAAYIVLGKVLGDKVYTADEKTTQKSKRITFCNSHKGF